MAPAASETPYSTAARWASLRRANVTDNPWAGAHEGVSSVSVRRMTIVRHVESLAVSVLGSQCRAELRGAPERILGIVRMRTRISSCPLRIGSPPSLEIAPTLVHVGVDALRRLHASACRLLDGSGAGSRVRPQRLLRYTAAMATSIASKMSRPAACLLLVAVSANSFRRPKDHLNLSAFDRTPRSSWIAASDRNSLNPYNPYRLGLASTITSTRT